MNILAEIAPLVTKHDDVQTTPNKPGIAEYLQKYYAKSSHRQESSQHEIPGQEIATTKNLHFGSGNADHIIAIDTPTKNATSSVSGQSRFLKTNLSSEKRLDGEVRENASTVS